MFGEPRPGTGETVKVRISIAQLYNLRPDPPASFTSWRSVTGQQQELPVSNE